MRNPPPLGQRVIMLGTTPGSPNKGGIWAVTRTYREAGLFDRWSVSYIGTHTSRGGPAKLGALLRGLVRYVPAVLSPRTRLVHAHVASHASFWRKAVFLSIAAALGKPTLCHLHGAEFRQFYGQRCGRLRQALIRHVLRRCTRVLVLSEQWRQFMLGLVPGERIRVLPNPVPIPRVGRSTSRDGPLELLFLGRLGVRKGVYDLLQALPRIRARCPAVHLCCAGDGDIEQVTEAVRRLGLSEAVTVAGWVEADAKEALLKRASVFVLPSYNEGLPVAVLEAMAYGLPVVATRVGGIPDTVRDGLDGFLVDAGDTEALADAVVRLAEEPGLRQRMGRAARGRAMGEFAADVVVARLEAIYREVLARPAEAEARNQVSPPGGRRRRAP